MLLVISVKSVILEVNLFLLDMADDGLLSYLTFLLVGVGALNWGLVGIGGVVTLASGGDMVTALTEWNFVHQLGSMLPLGRVLEALVYLVVGVAGVLDFLGISGGYGLFSDDRDMM